MASSTGLEGTPVSTTISTPHNLVPKPIHGLLNSLGMRLLNSLISPIPLQQFSTLPFLLSNRGYLLGRNGMVQVRKIHDIVCVVNNSLSS